MYLVLGWPFSPPGGDSGAPFPVVPLWGSSLGSAVGSSPILAEGCWFLLGWVLCVLVVRAVFAVSCVLCVCGACVGGGCGGGGAVCCVCAGACVVLRWCVWLTDLASPVFGWRLCVGGGIVCCGPSLVLAEGTGWGSLPLLAGVRWCWCIPLSPCVLFPLFPLAAFPCVLLPWCLLWDYPGCGGCAVGWVGWGGSLDAGSGPIPWCFPFGGAMLALPVRV